MLCFTSESFSQNDNNDGNDKRVSTLNSLSITLAIFEIPSCKKNASRTNNNNNCKDSFFLLILKLFQHLLPKLALVSNASSNKL